MSHEQSAARRTPGGASSNHHSGATSEHHSHERSCRRRQTTLLSPSFRLVRKGRVPLSRTAAKRSSVGQTKIYAPALFSLGTGQSPPQWRRKRLLPHGAVGQTLLLEHPAQVDVADRAGPGGSVEKCGTYLPQPRAQRGKSSRAGRRYQPSLQSSPPAPKSHVELVEHAQAAQARFRSERRHPSAWLPTRRRASWKRHRGQRAARQRVPHRGSGPHGHAHVQPHAVLAWLQTMQQVPVRPVRPLCRPWLRQ